MDTQINEKQCINCKEIKQIKDFYLRKDTNKRRGECGKCWLTRNNKRFRQYHLDFYRKDRKDNPEKYKEKTRQYNSNNKEMKLWSGAKHRAKKRGLDFNIEVEDIIIPEFCPVLGIEIKSAHGKGPKDNSPSLDRIDNNLGYIKGNIRIISFRANSLKKDGTLEEFQKIIEDIKKNC